MPRSVLITLGFLIGASVTLIALAVVELLQDQAPAAAYDAPDPAALQVWQVLREASDITREAADGMG